MNDLKTYRLVATDMDKEDFPSRSPEGVYHWSQGQRELLDEETETIRSIDQRILVLEKEKEHAIQMNSGVNRETLLEMDKEHDAQLKQHEKKIVEAEMEKDEAEKILKKHVEAVNSRGLNYRPGVKKPKKVKPTNNSEKKINWRLVGIFLGQWVIGEIFMTGVLFQILRDSMGIIDIIYRTLALGLMLGLIHYVDYLNKKNKNIIYKLYIIFNLLMIVGMILLPVLANNGFAPQGTTQDWSFSLDEGTPPPVETSNGWIDKLQLFPAVISFLIFIAIQSFVKVEKKPEKKEKKATALSEEQLAWNKADNLNDQFQKAEAKWKESKNDKVNFVNEYKAKIEALKKNQESLLNRAKSIKEELETSRKNFAQLMSDRFKALEGYRVDFESMLKADETKGNLIRPAWPNEYDFATYYQIKSKL